MFVYARSIGRAHDTRGARCHLALGVSRLDALSGPSGFGMCHSMVVMVAEDVWEVAALLFLMSGGFVVAAL
jgi:hypothetical protein